MKKAIFAFTSLLFLCITAFKNDKSYHVIGLVKGLESGKIYLSYTLENKNITDSALITEGKFSFKGSVPEVIMCSVKIQGSKQQKNFFLENKEIYFTAHKDSLFNAKVTGSPETEVYYGFYMGPWKAITKKAGAIYHRLDSANQNGKVTLPPDVRKSFDDEFKALDLENQKAIRDYVTAHAGSIAVAAIVQDRFINYPYPQQASEMYNLFTPEVKNSYYGRAIKTSLYITNRTAPGKTAPDFSMKDVNGKTIKLSQLRGQYVLVDFWASWCIPCRKENPNVVNAYKKYHKKGFEILGVSLDSKKEPWLKAIKDDGLIWKHVSELKGWTNSAATLYGVKSVPASFLLDKQGKVIAKDLRGEELNKKLLEIFKD